MMGPRLEADEVRWGDLPPADAPEWVQVLRPGPRDPVGAIVTSTALEIVYAHWCGERSQPCTQPTGRCAGCRAGLRATKKGYLGAYQSRRQRNVILELTEHAMCHLPPFTAAQGFSWRGWGVRLYRTNSKRNASVAADLQFLPDSLENLPAPFDVRKALVYLWGVAWLAFASELGKMG
jgi:hypothetical protein